MARRWRSSRVAPGRRSFSSTGPPPITRRGAPAGPVLETDFRVHAIDRRGRGASGDGTADYAIEREYEDLAAVADAIAGRGGRARRRRRPFVRRAHRPRCGPADREHRAARRLRGRAQPGRHRSAIARPASRRRIAELIEAGDRDAALATFFREIVRMPDADLAAYRADPIWPVRAAAVAHDAARAGGEASPAASLDALGRVVAPVLQVLGGDSAAPFREATEALDARLARRPSRSHRRRAARRAPHPRRRLRRRGPALPRRSGDMAD